MAHLDSMKTRLARLVALVPLLSPPAGSGGEAVPPDLELASLAVTDGIVGGFIRRRASPEGDEVWVAELEPAQFRALLELAVASGLPELPLEDPPSCMDVYG